MKAKTIQKIAPCLWFDDQAEAAAKFYTGVFKNSQITTIGRYSEAGQEFHGRPPGSVMIVAFELDGQPFTALNGGPQFTFSEAISFQISCDTQKEVDFYWEKLSKGGEKSQCGWLKDKFGVSWQVVPSIVPALLGDHTSAKSQRAMQSLMTMTKPDIAKLKKAYAGK